MPAPSAESGASPSKCAFEVASLIGKNLVSLATHEKGFIEYKCSLKQDPGLIAVIVEKLREVDGLVGDLKDVGASTADIRNAVDHFLGGKSNADILSDHHAKSGSGSGPS